MSGACKKESPGTGGCGCQGGPGVCAGEGHAMEPPFWLLGLAFVVVAAVYVPVAAWEWSVAGVRRVVRCFR